MEDSRGLCADSTQCRGSCHDSHGHAVTSTQSFFIRCHISRSAKVASVPSLSLPLIVSLHSHNLISCLPDPRDSFSPFTPAKWSQHSRTTHSRSTQLPSVGFIISLFCRISVSSCGFSHQTDLKWWS